MAHSLEELNMGLARHPVRFQEGGGEGRGEGRGREGSRGVLRSSASPPCRIASTLTMGISMHTSPSPIPWSSAFLESQSQPLLGGSH